MDRIDNGVGYVPGNTQIIAACLNKAKGAGGEVPAPALRRLWYKLETRVFDALSTAPQVKVAQ